MSAFLYLLRTSFYFISIIYLHYYAKAQKDLDEYIKPGLMLFTVVTLLTSFIQYFLYPNLRNLTYLGWDPHLFRIFGVFLDTSIASAIFGLILLFLIINYKKFTFSVFSRTILIITFVTLGLLTYSRGFYLSILTTLFFYFLLSKKLKFIIVVLAVFTFALLILPKPFGEGVNLLRTYSIESRAKDYEEGLAVWKKSPLFGIGYNHLKSIREISRNLPSHSVSAYQSSFLTILVTSGIIGLISFGLALKGLWYINPSAKFYLMFLIVFSFMDNILLHPFILFLLLFLVNDS
ncbi:MAG: O-antigen ligase family protein, partial [Patescibacteria group bacterium]